jgi:hypothetical protein
MGSPELYDRNTCIQVLSTILVLKKSVQVLLSFPKKKNSMIMIFFSVLLWSFNEIEFLFNCPNT